ncbi:MAG: hypothetical protein SGCHY_003098 [Lobulomycetales sp.]
MTLHEECDPEFQAFQDCVQGKSVMARAYDEFSNAMKLAFTACMDRGIVKKKKLSAERAARVEKNWESWMAEEKTRS